MPSSTRKHRRSSSSSSRKRPDPPASETIATPTPTPTPTITTATTATIASAKKVKRSTTTTNGAAQTNLTRFFNRKDPPGRKSSETSHHSALLQSPSLLKTTATTTTATTSEKRKNRQEHDNHLTETKTTPAKKNKKTPCSDPPEMITTPPPPSRRLFQPSASKSTPVKTASKHNPKDDDNNNRQTNNDKNNDNENNENKFEQIKPTKVVQARNAQWKVVHNCVLVRKISKQEPRTKVAAFDLDGTILNWTIAGWPSSFEHYELWNSDVLRLMRQKYDQGYKLVVFSNQGGIRKAFEGKTATLRKHLIEWLAAQLDRPLFCCISTSKKDGYHKPSPGMWKVCQEECNRGVQMDVTHSFYVGDSVGEDDPQGGVDEKFAKNVGAQAGGTLEFFEPQQYFGPSNAERRKTKALLDDYDQPPDRALKLRAALLGGYLKGPILLVLCGVQGSGKSTFSTQTIKASEGHWVVFSQDTINKGKPGTRQKVENETRAALKRGQSVIVDRMHLDEEQRSHFVDLASEMEVPVHAVVLNPPKEVVLKRVRARQNHPAGVEGENGVRVVQASLSRLKMPKYAEGFCLVSITATDTGAEQLYTAYRSISPGVSLNGDLPKGITLQNGVLLPSRALGTMKIGKRVAQNIVGKALELGFRAVDTAPSYKNESEVGAGLGDDDFCIVKVPYRAVWPEQVREEIVQSLENLNKERCSLLLLHWPANFIEAGTLESTWQEMEKCYEEGICSALGVCNFNIGALRKLLMHCKIRPSVNQVERHPLLPQWDLLDFCLKNDIVLQSHTCLGQGKPELLQSETICEVAKTAGVSPAQTVVQWNLMHGVPVVVKCSGEEHMKEIMDPKARVESAGMKALDSIGKRKLRFVSPPFMSKRGAIYAWE